MADEIIGPLGIWRFPVIRLILAILEKVRGTTAQSSSMKGQPTQKVKNVETWHWIDCEGNKRIITVHRSVEPVES